MKRSILIATGSLMALALLGFAGIIIWIDSAVKENIGIAKEKHPGKADDALIAYLRDTTTRRTLAQVLQSGHWDRFGPKRQSRIDRTLSE